MRVYHNHPPFADSIASTILPALIDVSAVNSVETAEVATGEKARMTGNRGIFEHVAPAGTVIHLVNSGGSNESRPFPKTGETGEELGIISSPGESARSRELIILIRALLIASR